MLSKEQHLAYLRQALDLASQSPPQPSNFRVGAVLVTDPRDEGSTPTVISTGYTLELPGNRHAEECAIAKLATEHSIPESSVHDVLTSEMNTTLYTTMEPCGKRLSGKLPCVNRILLTRGESSPKHNGVLSNGGIQKVVFGAKEPGTFVLDSASCRIMDKAGLKWEYVPDLQHQILQIATKGHGVSGKTETNVDDIDKDERTRQEQIQRNPKKRMMEASLST